LITPVAAFRYLDDSMRVAADQLQCWRVLPVFNELQAEWICDRSCSSCGGPRSLVIIIRMQPHAADEQYSLANQYYDGKGLPQNLAEAGKLYRLAADQGHSMAQTRLGEMYEGGYGV
jgi:TPR repeat protein